MSTAILTHQGQVTIPAEIRKKMNLQAGDHLEFVLEGQRLVLLRKPADIKAAFGLYQAQHSVSSEAIKNVIKARASKP